MHHYASKLEVIPIEQVASDWAIQKLHWSHHYWTSWPALDKEIVLQPSTASNRESENNWPGLWPPCSLRRLTSVPPETMRLSTLYRAKMIWIFFPHSNDKQKSPCCHNFLTGTQTYHSKVTPIDMLHAEKIAEAVLLYVFPIAFPLSHLTTTMLVE